MLDAVGRVGGMANWSLVEKVAQLEFGIHIPGGLQVYGVWGNIDPPIT